MTWPSSQQSTVQSSRAWFLVVVLVAAGALLGAACSTEDKPSGGRTGATETTESSTGGPKDAAEEQAKGDKPLARYADFRSETYENPASWLCRPDRDDICATDQDATVVAADGTLTVERWKRDPNAAIDCFYVYPTISADPTPFSDMNASDDQEGAAARNQVARLGQECRVFAPIYRQRTLAGLGAALAGGGEAGTTTTTAPGAPNADTPFADVLEAWKSYMAKDNNGRGVVLVGHSQGAGLLKQLLQSEFDPNDDVRAVLVSAYLAGTSLLVPAGADVGGDLKNIPLCRSEEQAGCVVTWSTYRASTPPGAGAFFGRPGPPGSGLVSGCVNPADLSGAKADAHSYFAAQAGASIATGNANAAASNDWVDPSTGPITTPFVTTPGLSSVACAEHDGYHYLQLTNNPDPGPRVDDIGGDMNAQWGMHLQDVNIVMGDMVRLVRTQTSAYQGN